MEVTREKYNEILKKQDSGELLIYIDTAGFRQFFSTKVNDINFERLIGESLKAKRFAVKLIMFTGILSMIFF